jgi:hypothetical protein
MDEASREWLLANLPSVKDELTRGSAWVTLWDAVLTDDVKPDAFLALAVDALAVENNELIVTRVLSYVRDAYWRFSTPAARTRWRPRSNRCCATASIARRPRASSRSGSRRSATRRRRRRRSSG